VSRHPVRSKARSRLALAGLTAALAAAGLASVASAAYVDDHRVELVTRTPFSPGTPSEIGDQSSTVLSVSADGRYVLINSSASNFPRGDLPPEENFPSPSLYRKDLQTGKLELVARPTRQRGAQNSFCGSPGGAADLSADGRYVAFVTQEQLDPRDTNWIDDAYVRDMTKTIGATPAEVDKDQEGAWEIVSALDESNAPAEGETPASYAAPLPATCPLATSNASKQAAILGLGTSGSEVISADGRRVIFWMLRNSNLPNRPNTSAGRFNLFWRDLDDDVTRLVTRQATADGTPVTPDTPVTTTRAPGTASISGDGTKVAWVAGAAPAQTEMVAQEYGTLDATRSHTFWRDMTPGQNAPTRRPASLVDYDDPACDDDALAALTREAVTDYSRHGPCLGGIAHSNVEQADAGDLTMSHDGLTLAWTMTAVPRPGPDGVGGTEAFREDVWVTSMASDASRKGGTRIVTRVPQNSGGPAGTTEAATAVSLSADGRRLAFRSERTDFSSLIAPAPIGPMPTLTSVNNVFRVSLAADRTPGLLELVTWGTGACGDTSEMNVDGSGSRLRYSADGSVIAFDSDATNLVVGAGEGPETPNKTDVFVSRPLAGPGPCEAPQDLGGGFGDVDTVIGGDAGDTTIALPRRTSRARLRLGAARVNRKGVVRLRLTVPRPGTLEAVAVAPNANASRRHNRRVTYGRGRATAGRPGAVTLVVRPTRAGRKLTRRGRLPVRIKVTYRPSKGRPATRTKRVIVNRAGRR
jgi:WD40-like Beta Propeller Repeat